MGWLHTFTTDQAFTVTDVPLQVNVIAVGGGGSGGHGITSQLGYGGGGGGAGGVAFLTNYGLSEPLDIVLGSGGGDTQESGTATTVSKAMIPFVVAGGGGYGGTYGDISGAGADAIPPVTGTYRSTGSGGGGSQPLHNHNVTVPIAPTIGGSGHKSGGSGLVFVATDLHPFQYQTYAAGGGGGRSTNGSDGGLGPLPDANPIIPNGGDAYPIVISGIQYAVVAGGGGGSGTASLFFGTGGQFDDTIVGGSGALNGLPAVANTGSGGGGGARTGGGGAGSDGAVFIWYKDPGSPPVGPTLYFEPHQVRSPVGRSSDLFRHAGRGLPSYQTTWMDSLLFTSP